MEYYSESNHPPMTYHQKCEKTAPMYEERINQKTLKKELVKTGETNVYEKIQESRDATDIQKIIERYQINIDNEIKINDEILDYTENPTDLIQAHQMILNAEQIWEKEPAKIKNEFNNNFIEYLAAANNGTLKNTYEKVQKEKYEKFEKNKEKQKIQKIEQQQKELLKEREEQPNGESNI